MKTVKGMAIIALSGALLVAAPHLPVAFAADEVLSGNIREADNRTGQSTNTGSGIKTNHIQNGAVTSTKIKDGGVATADLANGAVTSAKIKDGNVFTADLADGSVTAAKVGFYSRVVIVDANGGGDFTSPVAAMNAITDASADSRYLVKIMPGTYDVGQASVQMRPFVDIEGSGAAVTRIVGTVPSYGGIVRGASDAEIRFLTIENTSADIRPVGFYAPPGTAPSLLHLTVRTASPTQAGAGAYSFGVFCDLGSAPRLSHVTASASGGDRTAGVYANDASPTLTDVEASGADGSGFNIGVSLAYSDAAVLRRVRAVASGAGSDNVGNVAISIGQSSPVISDTTALAFGHTFLNVGVRNEGESRPELSNVTARALGGVAIGMDNWAQGDGTPGGYAIVVDRSSLEGATSPLRNDREFTVTIGASKLGGGTVLNAAGGTLKCAASYDGSYDPLPAGCVDCLGGGGTFDAAGGPYGDVQSCVDALQLQAATECCSGALNPGGGFVYGSDPYLCRGVCQ